MNNNKKILEDVKMKIAISNFNTKEGVVMKKKSRNILKITSAACLILVSVTGIVFAKDIEKFIKNAFGPNASDGVQIAVENDYVEKVEPTYVDADGIEIAVDSFLVDDYNLDMNFRVKINDKYEIEEMKYMQLQDLKILDENNDVVFVTREVERKISEDNKTAGTPNFEPQFWGGYSMHADITGENELILHLSAYGTEEHKIDKAKKLNVEFSKIELLKYIMDDSLNTVYTGNWKFDLDVPEEMYNRELVIYKMKSCNDDKMVFGDATLSNTAFKISILETTTDKVDYELLHNGNNVSDRIALGKEYVETSDGKKFEPSGRSDGDGGYSIPAESNKIINYSQTFNLTKFDATNTLTVHIFTNKGEEIIVEYEKSKN